MIARYCLAIMAVLALALAPGSAVRAEDRSIPLPPPPPFESIHPAPPVQPPAMPAPPVIYWPPPLEFNPLLPPYLPSPG